MISCTEFIPAYNELFKYLENKFGRKEVEHLWEDLFKPTGEGIPLINFLKKDGLRGAWDYWAGTLTEEAADCTKYFNEKEGWISSEMHYCPSKGRLLQLQKEIGLEPYYDYCGHCDYYRASLEEIGLCYIRNHAHVDKAQCQSIIYDPKVFKGMMVHDENIETLEVSSADREYFHPAFHSSLNRGIEYLVREHGVECLEEYYATYTRNVLKPVIEKMKTDGALTAIENNIRNTYKLEKAEDALHIENDGKTLSVSIDYCPAVKFLKSIDKKVSDYFEYSTKSVMQTLADIGNLKFEFTSYDKETGKASYKFSV